MSFEALYSRFFQRLVVSCQAAQGDPFRDPNCMARFAAAAVSAGAAGIRANGVEDIRAIRRAVAVPVIGLEKAAASDDRILITPSFEAARALVEAGSDIVAVDCTARGQRYGAFERVRRIQEELRVPVMADIATVEEAIAAAEAGAALVASTMRGYTQETAAVESFEESFIAELARQVRAPVVAEGRIHTPEQAAAALRAGAYAIIVGTAITAPRQIAEAFVQALERERTRQAVRHVLGIDLGGTNTKFGVVSSEGRLALEGACSTPWSAGRDGLLAHLRQVATERLSAARGAGLSPSAVGVATAGWVNPQLGRVVYATGNLPGWTGTEIGRELEAALGLPVAVENDANALAVGERRFGSARGVDNFVTITLGTGVGGGCYIGGRLNRGAHFFANALGHIPVEPNGLPCTCGLRGCLEAYTNAAALLRYAGDARFGSAEAVIRASVGGDAGARKAIQTQARHLATGIAAIVQLLDPELIVLSGGLVQANPVLIQELLPALRERLTVWDERRLAVRVSELGYHAGVLGAAAVALDRI